MKDEKGIPEEMPSKKPPFEAYITLVTPTETPSKSKWISIKHFETFVALVKAIAWPLLILYLFGVLREPITKTIALLPDKLSESTKFSVGSLSFEIQQTAKASGNPELANLIGGLSPQAIETLLKIGKDRSGLIHYSPDQQTFYLPDQDEMKALTELDQKGLVEFETPLEEFKGFLKNLPLKERDVGPGYRPTRLLTPDEKDKLRQFYGLSDLGKRASELIISTVSQELQKPTRSDREAK